MSKKYRKIKNLKEMKTKKNQLKMNKIIQKRFYLANILKKQLLNNSSKLSSKKVSLTDHYLQKFLKIMINLLMLSKVIIVYLKKE